MLVGPAFLGGLCLLFGLIPWWVSDTMIQPAVHAFYPDGEQIHFAIFHGFNAPLLLSIVTLTLGVAIYFLRSSLHRFIEASTALLPLTADGVYHAGLHGFAGMAVRVTRQIQNGSLYRYLLTTILVFTLATTGMWAIHAGGGLNFSHLPSLPFSHWLLTVLMAAAIAVVVAARSRILAVCALGIVGSGAALFFLMYGAPDLALTQLLVETLTLIIVSVILLRLPPLSCAQTERWATRGVNFLVAVSTGTLIAALSLATTRGPLDRQLTDFFEQHSAVAAHGRNIVNVILVDFRALDTLGEITVVATAGLAGVALLAKRGR
jgi:multicomponent Na+:H+ antiporter subunit A